MFAAPAPPQKSVGLRPATEPGSCLVTKVPPTQSQLRPAVLSGEQSPGGFCGLDLGFLRLCAQGSLSVVAEGPCTVLGVEPGSAECKARAFTSDALWKARDHLPDCLAIRGRKSGLKWILSMDEGPACPRLSSAWTQSDRQVI